MKIEYGKYYICNFTDKFYDMFDLKDNEQRVFYEKIVAEYGYKPCLVCSINNHGFGDIYGIQLRGGGVSISGGSNCEYFDVIRKATAKEILDKCSGITKSAIGIGLLFGGGV